MKMYGWMFGIGKFTTHSTINVTGTSNRSVVTRKSPPILKSNEAGDVALAHLADAFCKVDGGGQLAEGDGGATIVDLQ